MPEVGLTSGEQFLRDSTQKYFENVYGGPEMHCNEQVHKDLGWIPALWFTIHEHMTICVEPSEDSLYPRILEIKANDVRRFSRPITIYVVCTEEVARAASHKPERKRLENDGFGLIVIDGSGEARRELVAIPLIQIISKPEFSGEVNGLPTRLKRRVSEAYEDYCGKPVNGVRTLSEVVEGLVESAGRDAVRKGYIQAAQGKGGVADTLDALYGAEQCKNARAEIGGVRSYVSKYRNLSHHWPRTPARAYKKYADCRHAFLDGLKHIQEFRRAMMGVGLSGRLR